jgi:tRNA pseudouridine38-40 synthase
MPRYKLTLEYDGAGFVGWQRQKNGMSVQEALETAATKLAGGKKVTSAAAGRTDAGVHALGMVAHIDLPQDYSPDTVRDAINFHMQPHLAVVLEAELAGAGFHARFSALERRYLYRIFNRRAGPALEHGRVWRVSALLDHERMAEAAERLVGKHDFTTFRASDCQSKSPVKSLDELTVERIGHEIHIRARARSFLHHQVRNIVGTLKLAGDGKWTADDVTRALEARSRAAGGPTAPPHGLYFVGVSY